MVLRRFPSDENFRDFRDFQLRSSPPGRPIQLPEGDGPSTSEPTVKLSFEAPSTTFFDRLEFFSDALYLINTVEEVT